MVKKLVSCLSLVGFLTGCATTDWYNHNYSSHDKEVIARQKVIDEGYCTQVAQGAAPMPEARVYSPAQQSYSISGTVTSYGTGGFQTNNYTGYVTPSPATSFASGFAQGAALGATIRARRAQDAIMKGCMFKLGWTDKPIEQKSSVAPKQALAPTKTPAEDNSTQKSKDAPLTCAQWVNDIAVVVNSAYVNGVDRETITRLAKEYLDNIDGSVRQLLVLGYLINARYKIPLENLTSEDFPEYIRWECEQDWKRIGLGQK